MGRIGKNFFVILALCVSLFGLAHCGLGGTDCGNVTCPSNQPDPQGSTGDSMGSEGSGEDAGDTGGQASPGSEDEEDEEEFFLQGGG